MTIHLLLLVMFFQMFYYQWVYIVDCVFSEDAINMPVSWNDLSVVILFTIGFTKELVGLFGTFG